MSASDKTPTRTAKRIEPGAVRGPPTLDDEDGAIVTIEACGRTWRFPRRLIAGRPATLLAKKLRSHDAGCADAGAKAQAVLRVGTPVAERFACILDWYRYGEVHVPGWLSIASVLREAKTLQLPDVIVVNGRLRATGPAPAHQAAVQTVSRVLEGWPGFGAFFESLVVDVATHYRSVPQGVAHDEAYDFPPFVLTLWRGVGWASPAAICSSARARVVALKLEDAGFRCHFTATELVVLWPGVSRPAAYEV